MRCLDAKGKYRAWTVPAVLGLAVIAPRLNAAPLAPMTREAKAFPGADDDIADSIRTLLETAINDPAIKIAVRPVGDKIVVVLSGKPVGATARDNALKYAKAVTDKLTNITVIDTIQIGEAAKRVPMVSYRWAFGYLLGDTDFDGKQDLAKIAEALNALFPATEDKPVVTLKNTEFWLHGTEKTVQQIRGLLALIDAPAPQVRLEMWAIQYAGSQDGVGDALRRVTQDIDATKMQVELAKSALGDALHEFSGAIKTDQAFKDLEDVGFPADPDSSMSLIESLICLGITGKREEILRRAEAILIARTEKIVEAAADKNNPMVWAAQTVLDNRRSVFAHLKGLLNAPPTGTGTGSLNSDQLSVKRFADKLEAYSIFMDALQFYRPTRLKNPDEALQTVARAPEELAVASLPLNRHLEHLTTAFAQDMEAMYFQPLLIRAQERYKPRGGGVGLAGRTSIVVTSRLPASVTPAVETYAEKQVPNTIDPDFFSKLLKSANDAEGGVATLVPGLTNLEQALVLAALKPTAEVSYYKVAPGIRVQVTPAMTPDGTNALLKMEVEFGVETSLEKDSSKETLAYRPPDAVKSHTIKTTATVGGFNLFEVSSFNVETLSPRAPFIFPILGNLPLVGPMFRFSHSARRTYFQSVILTNATLVPRGLGLVNLYGANFAGSKRIDDLKNADQLDNAVQKQRSKK